MNTQHIDNTGSPAGSKHSARAVIIIDLGSKKNNHLARTNHPKQADNGLMLSVSCAGFTLSGVAS